MNTPLEAGVDAWFSLSSDRPNTESMPWFESRMRLAFVAVVRAAVGCNQCNGTGQDEFYCEAEHVELVVYGETIWADPDKCEWRCYRPIHVNSYAKRCSSERPHVALGCGWQPRWELIAGEQT